MRLSLVRFRACDGGNISIIFALAATALFSAAGAGIDLARSYTARQKLSEVAALTCQYASRPSVVQTIAPTYSGTNGGATYSSAVSSYITKALASQEFGYSQTNTTPFTYSVNGPADVSLTANVPTSFMRIVHVSQLSIAANAHCFDNASSVEQIVANGNTPFAVKEGFENSGCSGNCYYDYPPTGSPGTNRSTPLNTFPSSPTYTGANGAQWYVMGYCVEIDAAGVIKPAVAEGSHSAELDCDNGGGSAGNSSISTKVYLPAGNYELRYFYVSRVDYPDYDPAYICGSKASDVSWANSTNSSGGPVANALRTNQVNAYLDLSSSGGTPPTHLTADGAQTLAGSNLVDACVYAQNWVERSVRVYVSTAGYYWLSFAADGLNDSYGGQLDYIRLCPNTCPGSLQDNFPAAWLTAGKVLFEDTFEAPTYAANYYGIANTSGNLNNSTGTSGTAASGWPSATATGWATAPYNAIVYLVTNSAQGTQSLQFDSPSPSLNNRLASRSFLLMPGYYKVEYRYISDILFSSLTSVYCGSTPSAAGIASLSGSSSGTERFMGSAVTANRDTNIIGVFMSHASLASTPVGSGALNSQTSFTNPDGTTSTTATVPPNGLSLTSYNASQPNPLLDICGYASSWQTRTAYLKIQKPAYYWLTISGLGTSDSYGGAVDDVKLTALGSLFMATPPAGAVTIPVPDPQPGSSVSFSADSIIADPLLPPAPLQ